MARKQASPDQMSLFGGPAAEAPEPARKNQGVLPAALSAEIAGLGRALHPEVRIGPSTWSYPGWAGLVYDREYATARLAREGLAAVAAHPAMRAAGIDRTHYAPVAAAELAAYAAVVPSGFRFLVKAHEALTLARFPDRPRYGKDRGQANPRFLDAAYAADAVVAPFVEGLGEKAGALLFQFAPQDLGGPARFADDLGAFLTALPRGPLYAVELRNRELLTPRYAMALHAAGATHCVNAYPRMPDVATQARIAGVAESPGLVLRWLLGQGKNYEEIARLWSPFDRIHEEDLPVRRAIATLARETAASGRPALITVNNQAEGSAPLSMVRLVEEIVRQGSGGAS